MDILYIFLISKINAQNFFIFFLSNLMNEMKIFY